MKIQGEDDQREKPHKKSSLLTLWSWTSNFQSYESSVVSAPQSVQPGFGSLTNEYKTCGLAYGS